MQGNLIQCEHTKMHVLIFFSLWHSNVHGSLYPHNFMKASKVITER